MLYYGDRVREICPRELLRRIAAQLRSARSTQGGRRDSALVSALVDGGELAQGLADVAFQRAGCDDADPLADVALELVLSIARILWRSWRRDAVGSWPVTDRMAERELPARIRVNVPEGYAHYALYPQCYGEAALALRGGAPPVVIGIRSIGTSLGAMVAAACDAAEFVTVRPVGHPYRRRLVAGSALARRVASAAKGTCVAVVDEGPGMSGSAFGAVASWLEALGIPPDDVVFFPGHPGAPGPRASDAWRNGWARFSKRVVSFEEAMLPRLATSFEAEHGARDLRPIDGGAWRQAAGFRQTYWPPVFAQQERRKVLARVRDGFVSARFAGLGSHGDEALARAHALSDAGFGAPVLGFTQGFLVQRWQECDPATREPRSAIATARRELTRYLAFRASAFPAARADGASSERLLDMLRVNAMEVLGDIPSTAVRTFERGARDAEALPRVAVDGKLEWWEWVACSDGRVIKADGTDHAFGHDLAGCQPIAWDVAGARVELGLTWPEALELAGSMVPATTPDALAFMEAAYLALRLGRWTFAADLEVEPGERARIAVTLRRYRELLRDRLAASPR